MNQYDQLRENAQDALEALKRQRDGLDRKILEYEGFLTILAQMEPVARNGNGHEPAERQVADEDGLAGRIASVLRDGKTPMNARAITSTLMGRGYRYLGKAKFVQAVSSELARQAKKPTSGIRKVATGLYAAA